MSGVVLNTGGAVQGGAPVAAQPSNLQRFARALWRSRSGRFGALLLLLILLTTLGADLLPLADPVKRNLSLRYLPPFGWTRASGPIRWVPTARAATCWRASSMARAAR